MSSPYATPALTHGSSVFSRPGSSAFTSDTDVSNRVSVASCTRSSVDSPVVDTSTENKSKGLHQPHSASLSNASAIEVLSVDPNQHAAHEWSMPSPNGIGVGLTTEEDDDDNEQPGPLLRQESYNSLSNSGMWSAGGRQRSIAPSGSRSRSSSVAERIERARLSSATSSLADHTRSQLQGAVTPVHRVAGLQGASSDTTSWSLRGLPAEQVTIALDNMVSMTSLTSLDLSYVRL